MLNKDLIRKYVHPFRITKGHGFQLKDFDPADTCGVKMEKGEAAELLSQGTVWLAEQQDILYAQDRWSLLLVFHAMDAAGKDSTIKHVMSGSPGLPGVLLQATLVRGPRPRFPGATSNVCPNAGESAFSTVHITRRYSSCACTRKS
jgi:hypothetical protein